MTPTRYRSRERGFTLAEALVAATLGTMVLTGAYGAFALVSGAARRLDAHGDGQQGVRYLCAALEADLRSAVPDGERVRNGSWEAQGLMFEVRSLAGVRGQVRYLLAGDELRRTFAPLDSRQAPTSTVVAPRVAAWTLTYDERRPGEPLPTGAWPRAVALEVRFVPVVGEPEIVFRRRLRVEASPMPRPTARREGSRAPRSASTGGG